MDDVKRAETEKFRSDFLRWETKLTREGDTPADIEEIRQAVRDAWSDQYLRGLWIKYVTIEVEYER